ncbi:hypothetical protein KR074_008120 [Drosophila pseudoananassae]|nr:hypothetical protein KR074_008120 [Drosophila pseudoananassae]
MDTLEEEAHLRRHCDICEILEPPRAWNCKNCNRGMLTLDQHCNITGNSIGYYNHKYFLWLTFFMSLGTGLVLVFNAIDLLRNFGNQTFEARLKNIVFGINIVSFLVPTLHFFHPDVGGYRKLNLLGQIWHDL